MQVIIIFAVYDKVLYQLVNVSGVRRRHNHSTAFSRPKHLYGQDDPLGHSPEYEDDKGGDRFTSSSAG